MTEVTALRQAVDLYQVPSRVHRLREAPLAPGVEQVLRLVAGDDGALSDASLQLKRAPTALRAAAAFYVEQVMLAPEADSYRVLGATRDAPPQILRQHMALLMRWLHPDTLRDAERQRFANRVTHAWEDVKTPDRRARYDRERGNDIRLPARRSSHAMRRRDRSSDGRRSVVRADAFLGPVGRLVRRLAMMLPRVR